MLGASAKIKNDDDGGGGHGGDEDDFAFGVLPDDDDEQGEEGNGLGGLDDDLLDAVNDETFGGVVLPPADDLDGFAAQTARLDLDDAGELVRRPMSTAAAKGPDASQLPLPDFEAFTFGRLVDDDGDNEPPKIMGQGAAGGGTNANGDVLRGLSFIIGNDPFTPWSSKIPNDPWLTQRSPPGSPSGAENESPWAPRLPGASSSVASNIATAVPHARTLEEIEAAYQAAQQLPIGTPPRSASLSSTSTARAAAGLQLKPPGQQQPLQSPLVPLPTGAMSIQELEHKLLSESLTHTQQQPSQQSQPPQATPVGRPQGSGPPPILQPQPHPLISALQQQAPPPPHPSFMQPQPPIPGIPPQVLNQLLPLWADLLSGRLAQLPPNVPPPPVMFIPHIRQFIAHVQQQQQMQQQGAPPLATPHHHLHQHHQMMPAAKLAPGERAPPPPLAYGLAPHNGGPPPPYLAQTREDLAKQRAAAAAANNGSGRFQMPPIQQQQHAMRTMSSSSAAADYHQQQQQQLHHSKSGFPPPHHRHHPPSSFRSSRIL